MKHRRAWAGLVAVVVGLVAMLLPAPAMAWGNRDSCAGHTWVGHTNRWDPFVAHHVDVNLHGCYTVGTRTVPPHLIWTKTPAITYPDMGPGSSIVESVKTTKAPFVSAVIRSNGVVTKVRYKWSVKQCNIVKVVLCSNFDMTVAYALPGSHICFAGGACDDWKWW